MPDFLQRRPSLEDPELATWFDEVTLWSSRFGSLLLDNLALEPGLDALDVGCGTGFPLLELAQMHGNGCRFTGVDLWQGALRRARRKALFHGIPNAALVRADAAELPFPDRSFDLVVSNLGLNNFRDPARVARECYRVARPCARLAITTNLTGHMRQLYAVLRSLLAEVDPRSLPALEAEEAHRGSLDSVRALLLDAGFGITRLIERDFELRFLDGAALLRHSLCAWFLEGWRAVVDPERHEEVFAELERRLNQEARRWGELRMTIPMLYVEARRPMV